MKTDADKIIPHQIKPAQRKAYLDGHANGLSEKGAISQNPYYPDTRNWHAWRGGYRAGVEEYLDAIARRFKP